MGETGTRDSTVFPPGYGDFALESSDGLICHFPRHLLAYMSDTFRDMFSLPARDGKEGHSQEPQAPLKVTEPGPTLELFLKNIDPKQPTPPIDSSTVVSLLEAAQKYQAATITRWFEEEATLKYESRNASQRSKIEPFTATHPVLALYCAIHFNLPNTGRFALQEFTMVHISRTLPTKAYFDISSYLEGNRLRESRRAYFDQIIGRLADPTSSSAWYSAGFRRRTCINCTGILARWIMQMERAVRDEPNWRAFIEAYERPPSSSCGCNMSIWSDYFREDMSAWQVEAKAAESSLPAWPF